MIRTIDDFIYRWPEESEATLKVFGNLTDDTLNQAIPGGRSLLRLANHIIETATEFPNKLGLHVEEEHAAYTSVAELINEYKRVSDQLVTAVSNNWDDAILEEETNMYGEPWKNGFSLWVLMAHQTHHRAQMTVLMRFAGLKVPGVYGPSKEEWAAYSMLPQL
jgi:uncharacterized damage-inducible protein DinB